MARHYKTRKKERKRERENDPNLKFQGGSFKRQVYK